MSQKKRAIVVCPGRGSYNKEEMGYFARYHSDKSSLLNSFDQYRNQQGAELISTLDNSASFNLKKHTSADNASSLIYACAYADSLAIDTEQYELVAVTGNSMGWYIALVVAQAMNAENALQLIDTMGAIMASDAQGDQLIYPLVDEHWQIDLSRKAALESLLDEVNINYPNGLFLSIDLGGYWVFAGTTAAINALQEKLPVIDERYPVKLFNHAAYHSPLMAEISAKAMNILEQDKFVAPKVPLIDGLGHIWQPYSTDLDKLFNYTLSTQVTETYHFNRAIEVAIKEFAPEHIILLGPGSSLGGSIAQNLINMQWQGLSCKQAFIERQKSSPVLLSMGIESQRRLVVKAS